MKQVEGNRRPAGWAKKTPAEAKLFAQGDLTFHRSLRRIPQRQQDPFIDGAERGDEVTHVVGELTEERFAVKVSLIHVEAAVDLDLQAVSAVARPPVVA